MDKDIPPEPRTRFRPWALVSAAWIVPALLGGLNTLAQQRIWGDPRSFRAALFTATDWLLYGAITPFVFLLARRFPLSRPRLASHVALHLAAALAFCVAWAGLGTILKAIIQPGSFGAGVMTFFVSWLFTTLPFGVAVYLAVVGVEHAVRYFVEVRDRDAQVARLSEQLAGARLAALQAQLNPHFLFNTLNTVAVLVRDGERQVASRVLEQLSDLLRRTLNRKGEHEVPLADELELVRQYLALEQVRFSDRLDPQFDVEPDTLAALVPPFALQHLVENAVRHGVARRTNAGRVTISARRAGDVLEMRVTDDGPGIPNGADQLPRHGLADTRERLNALYGDRAALVIEGTAAGTTARMRMPFHVRREPGLSSNA